MLTACSELPVRFELPVGNPASSARRSVWFPLGGAAAAATSPPAGPLGKLPDQG